MNNPACLPSEDREGRTQSPPRMAACDPLFVPIWEKYTLSVEEAAAYFRIGEGKLRSMIRDNRDADFLFWNGNRVQIKRRLFEKYIDQCGLI